MLISFSSTFKGLLCLLAIALLVMPLQATLVPRLSLEEMTGEAQFVVHGTVARKWCAWDIGGQMIWTHYELNLQEALKGNPGSTLVVSEPGGIVGDQGMSIAGTPQYEPGDEVVLLVWQTPIGYLRTSGWGQGKFTVTTAASSSAKIVHAPLQLRGVELVLPQKASGPAPAGTLPGSLDGLSLAEFKGRLKSLIAATGGVR